MKKVLRIKNTKTGKILVTNPVDIEKCSKAIACIEKQGGCVGICCNYCPLSSYHHDYTNSCEYIVSEDTSTIDIYKDLIFVKSGILRVNI